MGAGKLRFETDPAGRHMARIHLAINLYLPDGTISVHKEERNVEFDQAMQREKELPVECTLPLAAGKNKIDLLVRDEIGGRTMRKFLSIKKK